MLFIVFVVPIWTITYEPKAFYYAPYPLSVFLPPLLMGLKYQTLRLWMGTCSVILLLSMSVVLSLDLCISLMVLRVIFLLRDTWLFILTLQLFQYDHVFHKCVLKQVVSTFIMFWCLTRCLHSIPLPWNLLCNFF